MNDRTLKNLRQDLEHRKAEIEGDVSYMAGEFRAIGVDQDDENGGLGNHMADDGANVAEAERIETVSEDLQQILKLVNNALQRMDDGTYGLCERCGKPIPVERLEAVPYVEYDIGCQSHIEREQALYAGA